MPRPRRPSHHRLNLDHLKESAMPRKTVGIVLFDEVEVLDYCSNSRRLDL
jgi:hypothetical protein